MRAIYKFFLQNYAGRDDVHGTGPAALKVFEPELSNALKKDLEKSRCPHCNSNELELKFVAYEEGQENAWCNSCQKTFEFRPYPPVKKGFWSEEELAALE